MPIVLNVLLMLASFSVTVFRGPAACFAIIFLPIAFFFPLLPRVDVQGFPDPNAFVSIGYGVLLATFVRGLPKGLRWSVIDSFMLFLYGLIVLNNLLHKSTWDGISAMGNDLLGWLVPYYLGRCLLIDPVHRRMAVYTLSWCLAGLCVIALYEARLAPYGYSRFMESVGLMADVTNREVFYRFGLARPQAGLNHPIDLGNMCVLGGTMLVALAFIARVSIRSNTFLMGISAAAVGTAISLSFTSYMAGFMAVAIFGTFLLWPMARQLIVPVTLAVAVFLCLYTGSLMLVDTSYRSPNLSELGNSLFTRTQIVQEAMKYAYGAGLFGYGKDNAERMISVYSVDNAYMLFILNYGWLWLAGFIGLAVSLAFKLQLAAKAAVTDTERMPIYAMCAGVLGMLVAMYTVWFGFTYSIFWTVGVGFTATMCSMLTEHRPAVVPNLRPRETVLRPPVLVGR